jgi:hypothetical protein
VKAARKARQKKLEVLRPDDVCAVVGLSVSQGVLAAKLVNRFFAALVPYFVEPAANEICAIDHTSPVEIEPLTRPVAELLGTLADSR